MSEVADSLFSVTVEPRGAGVCVLAAGELDLATAGRIERELVALLEAGCAAVEIDLCDLEFIDSSGIHELLRCRDRAAARAVPLRLLVAPGAVLRTVTICGVLDRFEVEIAGVRSRGSGAAGGR
jgi:anti-sigma B factor antagonist